MSPINCDRREEVKGRKIVKATKKRSTGEQKAIIDTGGAKINLMTHEKVIQAYSSLLNVYSCSREHLIVGRIQEE